MKSPFASLNWGVHPPDSPYVFIITNMTTGSDGVENDEEYLHLHSNSLKFYTSFAGAFQAAFNQSASMMGNRAEMWVEEGNQSYYTSPQSIFDIQGFYNEAPRTATVTFLGNLAEYNIVEVAREHWYNIWNYLSSLSNGLNTWEDFRRLINQELTETQRDTLNTESATVIETLPDMNSYTLLEFSTKYKDDYYRQESRVTIQIMPRNMEGRA